MNSFFDYLIKQNDIDQTRFVLDGHPIPIEYHRLIQAYKLRNDIVHEVTKAEISKSRVIAMWDNLLNVMDLSASFFYSVSHPEHRASLDSLYDRGKRRAIKMAKYKLSSDTIMSKILEKNKLGLKCNRFDFPDQIMAISSNKILAENVDDRISEMKNEGLIVKDQGSITLALKGEKRFKRTTERDRDRWKREISDIVCSWIRPMCTS